MPNRKARWQAVLGDKSQEARAIQILALALSHSYDWAVSNAISTPRSHVIPPLLHAASKAVSLASLNAPDPPVEVLALSARNVFELYLRLRHCLAADANCQVWLAEAVADQIQIYEGILGMDGPESDKTVLRQEIDRLRQGAVAKELQLSQKLLLTKTLAREVALEAEYSAFYKLYSKLVHPSSFVVNFPPATVEAPMYRSMLILNVQIYGHLILDDLAATVGLPADTIRSETQALYEASASGRAH